MTVHSVNGLRRFELLLDAAERLLQSDGNKPLTVQKIAREANVPTSSAYHFLPSPAAISIALAERYMSGFGEVISAPIPHSEALSWQEVITILHERAIAYYLARPYAQKLILGSDHSWAIRQADVANNRHIAATVAQHIAQKLPHIPSIAMRDAILAGICVGDAIFTLSIAEFGEITPELGREATAAACCYLAMKFQPTATVDV